MDLHAVMRVAGSPTQNHRGYSMRRMACASVVVASLGAHRAAADRYEATLTLRPIAAIGRVTEDVSDSAPGAPVVASTYGGGGEVGLSYGLRNWLDVGAELVAAELTTATYASSTVAVEGNDTMGRLTRRARFVQLRGGTTFRFGVIWVPTVHLGLGLGARVPTAATLRYEGLGRTFELVPDGMSATVSLDVVANVRVGLEHRFDRRWTVGLGAEAMHAIGFSEPPLDVFSAGVSLSYTWYPVVL
jgi:hypothetical protein